jgi:hypothetical protein
VTNLSPEKFDSAKYMDKVDEALLKALAFSALDPRSSKREAERARQALSARSAQRAALALKYGDTKDFHTINYYIDGKLHTPPERPEVIAAREREREKREGHTPT